MPDYRSNLVGRIRRTAAARSLTYLAILAFAGVSSPEAWAQPIGEPIPIGNRYGMSRPLFPVSQPRSLSDPRRAARLDYYQQQASRLRYNPFRVGALHDPIAGVLPTMARFQNGRPIFPSRQNDTLMGPISPTQLDAFKSYGGFGSRRLLQPRPGDMNDALQRRTTLVEATSLYAPVVRANLENASVAGLRASLDLAPMPQFTRPLPDGAAWEPPSLEDKFSDRLALARERKLSQAWEQFRTGEFNRAIHDFKSVAALSDDDTEAEIAMVFCNVAMGAPRTAVTVLARIARKVENPFAYDLDVSQRFGRRVDVDILKARARFQATAGRDNPALVALSTLVFWYLGDREEARSTVEALRTDGIGTVFESWPDLLDQAMAQPSTSTRTP